MLTREQNDLITETGPETPGGELLRRYWQPVGLAEEIPQGSAPTVVQILGEKLVLFRDEHGRPGLLGLHCTHRGANLSFGRIEDGGLRCLYHGWLYNVEGRCLEQPGEPEGSDFRDRVKQKSYPCLETGGMVFAYMGPGDPPSLPGYELLHAPANHVFARKYFQDCNYLQGNEGNIDPIHLSYLHRMFEVPDEYSSQHRPIPGAGKGEVPMSFFAKDKAPLLEVEPAEFGVRVYSVRKLDSQSNYVRISNFVMPNTCAVPGPMGSDGYNMNWHVPIDDMHHWKYMVTFRRSGPLAIEELRKSFGSEITTGYRLQRNASNNYGQDREEMRTRTFSGLGSSFIVHDTYATESQGTILDRTQEHLGYSDRPVAAMRQAMLRAVCDIQEGRGPAPMGGDPSANELVVRSEVLPAHTDWRTHWRSAV